jgi:sec-independent protein translocase protein TatC
MAVVPFPDPQSSKEPSDHDEPDRWSHHDSEELAGGKMSFLEHLDELRKRLIYSLVSLCIGVGIAALFIEPIYQFVMRPMQQMLHAGGKLIYTEGPEAFMLYVRLAIIAGLVIAAPLIMVQLWLFISPALFPKERRFAVPFVVLASAGFIGGAAFSHYLVFPVMWRFFASFSNDFVTFEPRVEPAFDLYIKMLLAMALVFQMPTIVLFLARFGLVTARMMITYSKYAILVIFILAAVITPSQDMASQLVVAVPMTALYIISILVAAIFGKRKPKQAES